MGPQDLSQIVLQLSPEEQSAVKEFIAFLRERHEESGNASFKEAIDEFIAGHGELLRRLAQ